MKLKNKTIPCLTNFIAYNENKFSTTLKCLESDNGIDLFLTYTFPNLKGLCFKSLVSNTFNGIVERNCIGEKVSTRL